jgi:seryl-tRNA synthetase
VIDLRRLRDEPAYRLGIERKRAQPGLLDELLALDGRRRALRQEVEALRGRQNAASKEIGQAPPDERAGRIEAAGRLKAELTEAEAALSELEGAVAELALQVPNPADESVPDGGEDDGVVVKVAGATGPAPRLDHAAFGESLGFVDAERGAEASGSRFAYLMREAVLVELALVQWVMGRLVGNGFTPVVPPVLVRESTMLEAGFFPTDRAQVYDVDGGELFLVGTSEVPLAMLHRGDTFGDGDLPQRYAGFSTCFRREAGTYGKDTKGIFRVHQFDKVEMFSYCDPDLSRDEHERILAIEEGIVGDLGLPYRVVNIAAGDLGAAAAKKYDLEVWLPSEGKYRELTSCSNYLDYSARRQDLRVRAEGGTRLVHTLNGTACAVSRTLVFLFEHYQDPDGAFVVPDVLRPICGFDRVEPK